MSGIGGHWRNAIIISAQCREFKPGENFHYPQVQSCYLVSCLTGQGKIDVNGRSFQIFPGVVLFCPWNHTITYMPDTGKPYVLNCIHIVPDAREHGDIQYNAFHSLHPEHPLYHWRNNELADKFNLAAAGQDPGSPLNELISYAVRCFVKQAPEEKLRLLAQLLFYEIYDMLHSGEADPADQYPPAFRRMLNHIEDYLELPVNITQLKFHSSLSSPSIYRLFRKYLDTTPGQYLVRRRLFHAAKVLRESTIPVAALAVRLQFSTPGNFSRAFKAEFGVSPRQFRESSCPPPSGRITRPPRHTDTLTREKFTPLFIPDSKLT